MTPAQLEHLKLIDAHLERLIAIAEKRTPGEWEAFQRNEEIGTNYCRITFTDRSSDSLHGYCGEHNAAFIASCAGNAEAGWRATRAVIKRFHDSAICREWHGYMQTAVEPILAAFPLELIQKP